MTWEKALKDFTNYIRGTIFPRIAQKLGLQSFHTDYYTLDAIFYEGKDVEHFSENTTYAKYISVAIEHENIASTTHIEMNKLQLFNTPLKVLIAYAAAGAETDKLLDRYLKIMRAADVFDDVATLRRQLVVFGTPNTAEHW